MAHKTGRKKGKKRSNYGDDVGNLSPMQLVPPPTPAAGPAVEAVQLRQSIRTGLLLDAARLVMVMAGDLEGAATANAAAQTLM